MAVLNGKKTLKNLLKKGFIKRESDHHVLEFWHDGIMITKTKTSHNGQDINDGLIDAMHKQCRVPKQFFVEFAKCTKSKEDYIKKLKEDKIIIEK